VHTCVIGKLISAKTIPGMRRGRKGIKENGGGGEFKYINIFNISRYLI
jgi:hypothetical protein